jgi:hypothetical protein
VVGTTLRQSSETKKVLVLKRKLKEAWCDKLPKEKDCKRDVAEGGGRSHPGHMGPLDQAICRILD